MRRFALLVVLAGIASAREPVRARHAMVVTVESHATDAGEAVLQAGGNAVDAAVAVAFTLAVTHPSAGNIGGGGFMLVRLAGGETAFLDFRERAPAAASHDMYLGPDGNPTTESIEGYRASGIPGTVAGMAYAHLKFGVRPWKTLVQPAVELARNGFPVSWGFSRSLHDAESSAKLAKFNDSKRIFLNDGKGYEAGDILRQPDLTVTLERIRDFGSAGFYHGPVAHQLAEDMRAHGGLISENDLAGYKVIDRPALVGKYRDYTVITSPPPSSGGLGILQMMGVLEGTDYARTGAGSARTYHFLAEAMRRYFADRSEWLGDPEFFKIPVTSLLSPHYVAALRASINPDHATPSAAIKPATFTSSESTQTTHFSIVDAQGNAVSVTYTLNGGFGSGVTAEGLGFLLNNEMDDFAPKPGSPNYYGLIQGEANAIVPGKTPLSSMTPTILLQNGKLRAVLGTPGGPTIINSVLQVALNLMEFGMNAQQAVDQPRIHHQWMPDKLLAEETISPDTIELLSGKYGHDVALRPRIGEMAVIRLDNGWIEGAPDGRTEGTAKGY